MHEFVNPHCCASNIEVVHVKTVRENSLGSNGASCSVLHFSLYGCSQVLPSSSFRKRPHCCVQKRISVILRHLMKQYALFLSCLVSPFESSRTAAIKEALLALQQSLG